MIEEDTTAHARYKLLTIYNTLLITSKIRMTTLAVLIITYNTKVTLLRKGKCSKEKHLYQ